MFLSPETAEGSLESYEGLYLETEIQLENEVNDLPGFINFPEKQLYQMGSRSISLHLHLT